MPRHEVGNALNQRSNLLVVVVTVLAMCCGVAKVKPRLH